MICAGAPSPARRARRRASGPSSSGRSRPRRAWTGESGHQRLFVAVAELMRLAAAGRGLLLVVDDLHEADEASLRLLHYLSRCAVTEPVLIVVAHREGRRRAPAGDGREPGGAGMERESTSPRSRSPSPDDCWPTGSRPDDDAGPASAQSAVAFRSRCSSCGSAGSPGNRRTAGMPPSRSDRRSSASHCWLDVQHR